MTADYMMSFDALRSSLDGLGARARNCPAGAIKVQVGVGCAAAIIIGKLRGTAPVCDCGSRSGEGAEGGCC